MLGGVGGFLIRRFSFNFAVSGGRYVYTEQQSYGGGQEDLHRGKKPYGCEFSCYKLRLCNLQSVMVVCLLFSHQGLKPVPSIRDYDLFEDCDDEYEEEAEEEEEEGDEMRDWVELEQSYHTCLQIDVANASF